uniref:BHLH domain-containing protein n=1 Tax=Biomphalaria glabrata TaxID=6526 RepID=A0A2C9JVS3_BIOGL
MVKERRERDGGERVKNEVDSASEEALSYCRPPAEVSSKCDSSDSGAAYHGGTAEISAMMADTGRVLNQVFSSQNVFLPEPYQHPSSEHPLTAGVRGGSGASYCGADTSLDLRLRMDLRSRDTIEPGEVVPDANFKSKAVEYTPLKDYESHSLSGISLEPLTPVLLHDKTQQYLQEHYHGVAPRHYHYDGDGVKWELENQRYTEISWKSADVYHDDEYSHSNNIDEAEYEGSNNQGSDAFNDSDVFSSSYFSDSSCTAAPSGHGRRRRKRVQTPVQRTAANLRERRRMCHLNVAFDKLKEHLPNVKDKKKLSRIQTLKAAIFYIHVLKDSLNSGT